MRARFPTMAGVDAMQLKTLLRRSTLSWEDRQINESGRRIRLPDSFVLL